MEPVGAAEVARTAIGAMEVVDGVEAVQRDEGRAMPLAGLHDDVIDRGRRQPAADTEDARLRARDAAYDRLVLRRERVKRGVEPNVVGAELDGDERRVGRLDGAELRQR